MSQFYDQASLVVVPSGYKAGTVYAQKPLTTDGQLTFTRTGDTATRVNSAGLIEKVRTNLVLQSEQFNVSPWTLDTGGGTGTITVTNNYALSPIGTMTADRFQMTKGSVYAQSYQSVTVTNGQIYTASVYLKSLSGTPSVTMLVSGAAVQKTLTTEWVRYTTTFTGASGAAYPLIGLYAADSATADILAWGYQLELSDFGATSYIPTTTAAVSVGPVANVPRLDYLGSTCPRLLLEPQRTNLVTYSDGLVVANAFNATLSKNNAVSPDGYTNASLFTPTANANAGIVAVTLNTSAQSYTISIYLKGTVAGQKVRVFGDLQNIDTFTLTTSWARYTATFTGAVGAQSIYIAAGTYISPTQNSPFYLYGCQLEQGAYSTSLIPTLAASATRGADACSKTGISSLIGQTEGTVYAEIVRTQSTANDAFWININDNSANNWIFCGTEALGGRFYVRASNTVIVDQYPALTLGRHKLALAYKSGSIVGYLDGVQIFTSAATFTLGSLTGYNVGASSPTTATAVNTAGAVNQALLFKTRLTNAELAELTTL